MNKRLSHFFKLGLIAIPVGLIITSLLIAIFMSSLGDAFQLIALSIICTLGISLVIWLPLWYVVGYLLILVVRFILKLSRQSDNNSSAVSKSSLQILSNKLEAELAAEPALSKDQKAVVDYIKKATAKGLNPEQITLNLRNNGWALDSITWAFHFVGSEGSS